MKNTGLRIRSFLAGEHLQKISGFPVVEVCGDRRVLLEFHSGIEEYTAGSIRVRVKYGCIHVEGECLRVRRMSPEQLLICGRIDHIHLIRRRSV